MGIERVYLKNPHLKAINFVQADKNRFSWDILTARPEEPQEAAFYDLLILHINSYIQLMIKMSESLTDESMNQIKNIGLTKEICVFLIKEYKLHPKIKNSVLQLYLNVHISAPKRLSSHDKSSFR